MTPLSDISKYPPCVTILAVLTVITGVGIAVPALWMNAQTDAPAPVLKVFSGRATFQSGDAGGTIENNALITQKVINLQNTGSDADTFRTTLPMNPETRCGLNGPNGSYPTNTLPNTLPTTLDIPLAVNGTTYIVAVCVTKGLPAGPFTWSYKTVSVGALNANRSDVNPVIAETQDMVNVTVPPTFITPSSFTPPATNIPRAAPSAIHPEPSSPNPPNAQKESAVQKKLGKSRVKALKKQQQALRRELRSFERSLLRERNIAALGQVADLRDELYELDLYDPSAEDTLQSLQEEITDLHFAVLKKVKRGG